MNINDCLESYINSLNEDRIKKAYVPNLEERIRSVVGISRYDNELILTIGDTSNDTNMVPCWISFKYGLPKDYKAKLAERKMDHLKAIGAKGIKFKKTEERIYFSINVTELNNQL